MGLSQTGLSDYCHCLFYITRLARLVSSRVPELHVLEAACSSLHMSIHVTPHVVPHVMTVQHGLAAASQGDLDGQVTAI